MAKRPKRVEQCTTHHNGCDCREWRLEQMALALRIIRTWAKCDNQATQSRGKAMQDIVDKCDEALEQ